MNFAYIAVLCHDKIDILIGPNLFHFHFGYIFSLRISFVNIVRACLLPPLKARSIVIVCVIVLSQEKRESSQPTLIPP